MPQSPWQPVKALQESTAHNRADANGQGSQMRLDPDGDGLLF